jgi:aryl-alcohol dehydrogenase-like predicted oxidoreductase
MLYGTINGCTKKISRIVCGGDGAFGNDSRRLDHAFERGINAFDTARAYPNSEAVLGRWLRSRRRDEVFVLSKGAFPRRRLGHRLRRQAVLYDLDQSLTELSTDYIDAYLFHYDSLQVPANAVVEIAGALQTSGKVRVVGYSNFTLERLRQIHALATASIPPLRPSLVSVQMSLPTLNETMWPWPGSVSISGKDQSPTRQWYAEHNLAVFAYSALARGFFSTPLRSFTGAAGEKGTRTPVAPASTSWLRRRIDNLKGRDTQEQLSRETWLRTKFDSAANRERYRRATSLAASRGATAAQIGLAYVFHKNLNLFAVLGWSSKVKCEENIAALDIQLSDDDVAWLEVE